MLDAARAGDRQALETLLVSHYDRVHALCRRMLGHEADAVDATQDALLSAVRSIGRFDGRSSFGTWLYRIATNACIDELRRRRRRPTLGLADDIGADADGPGYGRHGVPGGVVGAVARGHAGVRPAFGGAQGDPADTASDHVDVDAALRSLPPEFRAAVVLREVCDLPYDEIALVLGVPIGTVRSRIARGRAVLAELMSGSPHPGAPGVAGGGNVPRGPFVGPGRKKEERTP